MESGFRIRWTVHALVELHETIKYLEENWTKKELQKFAQQLDHTLELKSKNPNLFQISSQHPEVRRAVVAKYNNLYYRTTGSSIEILSIFSNRKNPENNRL